jgi:hypothetical protein
VAIVLKSGSLNLLEPSGPAQAGNGIALPFTFTLIQYLFVFILTYFGPRFLICIFTKFLPIRSFYKFSKIAELFSGKIKVENTALNTTESVIF